MSEMNEPLLKLFRAHSVEAQFQDGWIVFPGRPLRATAALVGEKQHPAARSVQLDVRLEIAPGRTLIESFAGMGETREQATGDALHNFTANTFHVLLAAFFRPDDLQVTREEWVVGGRAARVTIGDAGLRGTPPVEGEPLIRWFGYFTAKLKEQELRPGTHWVRLYYAQMQGKSMVCEVLLDNYPWEEMQATMTAFDWPVGEAFFSVRNFLVLEVQKGGTVSPETAVAWLADLIAGQERFAEDEVYAAMAEAGVPDRLADRAYKLTQVAWGRALLAGMGVRFSPDYLWFDAAGRVVESGRLEEEACFVAATRLAKKYRGSPGFKQLALTSADVNAVNNALHKGSKPEDMVMGPAGFFREAPTEAGMENARKVLEEHMRASRKASEAGEREAAGGKPWWRFWG